MDGNEKETKKPAANYDSICSLIHPIFSEE